jgi:hypothetical protein
MSTQGDDSPLRREIGSRGVEIFEQREGVFELAGVFELKGVFVIARPGVGRRRRISFACSFCIFFRRFRIPSVVLPGNKVFLKVAVGVSAPFLIISASISPFSRSVHSPRALTEWSELTELFDWLDDTLGANAGVLCTVGD